MKRALQLLLPYCGLLIACGGTDRPTTPSPTPALPAVRLFEVSPAGIEPGESAVLRWEVVDAETIEIDQGVGQVLASGSRKVAPASTTTYTLTAASGHGQATRSVTVPVGRLVGSGRVLIHGTWYCDLDRGVETLGESADFFWEQVDLSIRYLAPQNGAAFKVLGPVDFRGVSYADLRAAQYSTEKINGSVGGANQIPAGTVLAARTDQGRYAKLKIVVYDYDLTIDWATYRQ